MSEGVAGAPRVIHTGQVVIDVTMRIEALPAAGAEVFAEDFGLRVGGGFNVLHAIRQAGVRAEYWGAIGDGLLGQAARDALERDGISLRGPSIPCMDTGICVAVTDKDAERTFLSTRGAETHVPMSAYDDLELVESDVLYLTGYSLTHTDNRAALEQLAEHLSDHGYRAGSARPRFTVVDTSPMIGAIPTGTLETINLLHPIWSANERETRLLAGSLGLDSAVGIPEVCAALARHLHSTVISRVGPDGAWWSDGGAACLVPSIPVVPVDTNGAGDAHSGVLCALLAEGESLPTALHLANVAGALSTTRQGPATCPTRVEIVAAGRA